MKKFINLFLITIMLVGFSSIAKASMMTVEEREQLHKVKEIAEQIARGNLLNEDTLELVKEFHNLGGEVIDISAPYTMKSYRMTTCVNLKYMYNNHKYIQQYCR